MFQERNVSLVEVPVCLPCVGKIIWAPRGVPQFFIERLNEQSNWKSPELQAFLTLPCWEL